jgi:hypothetical protein
MLLWFHGNRRFWSAISFRYTIVYLRLRFAKELHSISIQFEDINVYINGLGNAHPAQNYIAVTTLQCCTIYPPFILLLSYFCHRPRVFHTDVVAALVPLPWVVTAGTMEGRSWFVSVPPDEC